MTEIKEETLSQVDASTTQGHSALLDGMSHEVLQGTNSNRGSSAGNTIPKSSANGNGLQFSRSGLYTGSSADYEKPSLLKVGTGEGSQVYGWGLYASSERGVADRYTRATKGIGSGTILLNGEKIEAGHDSAAKRVAKRMGWIEDKGKRPTRELALALS